MPGQQRHLEVSGRGTPNMTPSVIEEHAIHDSLEGGARDVEQQHGAREIEAGINMSNSNSGCVLCTYKRYTLAGGTKKWLTLNIRREGLRHMRTN